MRISIDVSLEYQVRKDEAVLLIIEAALKPEQAVLHRKLTVQDAELQRVMGQEHEASKIWAMVKGERLVLDYHAQVAVDRPALVLEGLDTTPLPELGGGLWTYLHPSRYCPSDLFHRFVEKTFGGLSGGEQVKAMAEWLTAEISYVPGVSNSSTTAEDTFMSRAGVCRDFAHLMCTFARAAHVPARYTSVYAPGVTPQDFHAVAEVWLEGNWHMLDPTGMSSPDQTVIIASGRDAADVAFMETEGWATPIRQSVRVASL